MWEVRGPAERVDPNHLAAMNPGVIILEGAVEVTAEIVARIVLQRWCNGPALLRILVHPFGPMAQVGEPSDISLDCNEFQTRIAIENSRP